MEAMLAVALLGIVVFGGMAAASAQTTELVMEGSMDIKITHPSELLIGRDSAISVLIENNGWEDKQDISFKFSSRDGRLAVVPAEITVESLSQGGSHGGTLDLFVSDDANPGANFLNVKYSQVLIANNEMPQPPAFYDFTIPILLKERPEVIIHTKAPESIFTSAEFPIDVEVASDDIDIQNVSIRIIPPDDIGFRGETLHTFSIIKKDMPAAVTSRIITPDREIVTEYRLPFEIIVEYTDDLGEQKTTSKTTSLIMRPRAFMEFTTEGGIWLGDFFIAPYVSLGTIIGIPAGSLLTFMIRRKASRSRQKTNKK